MSVRISDVQINNFKLFDEFNEISDIEEDNLVLFDGPNGYGKTSVFDAIELALTGSIKRIYNNAQLFDGKNAYKNFILIKDESKKAQVSVTLINGGEKLKLIREYTPQHLGEESIERNPQKIFEKFKLICKLNDNVLDESEQEDILKKFGVYNFGEFFDKCCYLSQDENLAFFKDGDKDRTNALDFLFNTTTQENAIKDINEIKKQYSRILKTYKDNLEELNGEVEEKERKLNKENNNVNYIKLFIKSEVIWDQENYNISEKNYKDIINELDDFIYITNNSKQCELFIRRDKYKYLLKKYQDNTNKLTMKNNPLQYTLNYYKKIDDYNKIKDLYEQQQKLLKQKEYIEKRQYNKLKIDEIKKVMDYSDEEVKELNKYITYIEERKKSEDILSAVISDLNSTRKKIMNIFNGDKLSGKIDDSICPLCGHDWRTNEKLIQFVEEQKQKLQQLCSDDTLIREIIENDLVNKYINKIIDKIEEKTKELVEENYVLALEKASKYKESMEQLLKQLDSIQIKIEDKMVKDGYINKEDYSNIYNLINHNVPECNAQVNDKLNEINFKRYYEKYLNSDINELNRINEKLIKEKQKYIDYLYYNSIMKELVTLNNKVMQLNERVSKLIDIDDMLKNYINSKKSAIDSYKKDILRDIEPLLYVYSAKIIQQKFGGNIVQIDNKKTKNFKIINNFNSDQDIIHSMSSGQLTSVALAFLLCMNKVYCSDKFNVLLIDDPVQTVDDVNMVGFVDLIRHEFSDIQIIIATHEKDFANYIAYKFIKAKHTYKNYNMRKIILSEKSDI